MCICARTDTHSLPARAERLMLAFHRLWLDEGPENVMEFPRVFGAFKTRMEQHVSEGKLSDDFD